ncbi:RecB family exonuclease, partial [Patescibacteria group bacterium]
MRTSYSALESYKTCPLKFKYQYLDKLKAPKSIEAVFGTIIHSTLKKMFERTPLYPSVDELINLFTNKWNESKTDFDQEVADVFYEDGITIIKNFYKKNPPWNFNVLELESFFGITIEDEVRNESHTLAGIIDRVDKDPKSDAYEIIDYKTAKRMPSQDMLDTDRQLSIYNLGLLKKWPHVKPENLKLSLYFLKHNEKIETTRTLEDLEKTKKQILKTIHEIDDLVKKEKEFVPTPSALCDWCGYQKLFWKNQKIKTGTIST